MDRIMSLCWTKSPLGRKQSRLWKEKTCVSGQTVYLIKEREEGLQSKINSPAPHSKLSKQDLCHSQLHSQQLEIFSVSGGITDSWLQSLGPISCKMPWTKTVPHIPTSVPDRVNSRPVSGSSHNTLVRGRWFY